MVTYEQFVETCVTELTDIIEDIKGQLNGLKERYEKSPIWKNKALEQIFAHYDHSIKTEIDSMSKQMVFYDFKEECKRLDKYLNTLKSKSKVERNKLQKKVKDLQTRIKKDLRKIDRLDQSEIAFEDLDNEASDHMKKYKYEQRVKRRANQLLRLQGAKESARIVDKVFKYNGTDYKELNELISIRYRAIMQKKYKGKIPQRPINSTPNIADINEIIETFCAQSRVIIPDKDKEAFKIAHDIIKEVQHRREIELFEMMNDYEHDSHLRPQTIIDFGDEELNKRLIANRELFRVSYIKKVDELGAKLENVAPEEIGGEGTASDEEEEDEDEDEDDALEGEDDEDDEEISEDDAMEAGDANADEDDDDDGPILLDEATTKMNDADQGSSSSENKKRPAETNGTETNGGEPPKKMKVTESQEKMDENSAENPETSTNGEQTGAVETKEEENKVSEQIEQDKPDDSKSVEDQSAAIPSETSEEITEENTKKITEESTIESNQPADKQSTTSPSNVATSPSKAATDDAVKTDSNEPTGKSESDDSIKIVDLEDDNQKDQANNADDDDDVICLD